MMIELVGGPHDGKRLTVRDGDTEVHVEDRTDGELGFHYGDRRPPRGGRGRVTVYLYTFRETSRGLPIFRAQSSRSG
jgi:hypothetical protein